MNTFRRKTFKEVWLGDSGVSTAMLLIVELDTFLTVLSIYLHSSTILLLGSLQLFASCPLSRGLIS